MAPQQLGDASGGGLLSLTRQPAGFDGFRSRMGANVNSSRIRVLSVGAVV